MAVKTITPQSETGFITLFLGGVGYAAASVYNQRYEADGRPFPSVKVLIDTDTLASSFFDEVIHIGLDAGKLNAIQSDPDRFGPAARTICDNLGQYLSTEDAMNGSRTIRALTQLAFAIAEVEIVLGLRRAIHQLVENHRIKSIIVILVGSSGGGTGSALQILLPLKLRQPEFRSRILQGFSTDLLSTPISFVSDPYALAHLHAPPQAARILANSYAFRIESAELERIKAVKYVIHLGFANSKGTILSQPDLISRVLGTSVYEWQRSWPVIKNRHVDTVDINALSKVGYLGGDLPETHINRSIDSEQATSSHRNHGSLKGGGA